MNSDADDAFSFFTAMTSGWHVLASFLYAAFMSWHVAVDGTPRTSYREVATGGARGCLVVYADEALKGRPWSLAEDDEEEE